jgi:hypothetical protein
VYEVKMDKIAIVLLNRYAGKAWCYNHDGYEGIRWTDSSPKPTEAELLAQFDEVKAEIDARRAAENAARASALTKLAALGLSEAEVAALLGA